MVSFLNLFEAPPSPFEPPSLPYQLFASPIKYLAQILYSFVLLLRGPAFPIPPPSSRVRLVCISDTHTHKPSSLPLGDVLIHAGDLSNAGTVAEIQEQVDWLSSLPHEHKIVIAGNHDSFCDPRSRRPEDVGKQIDWKELHYLQHSSITLTFAEQGNRKLHFYGAPQIPQCGGEDFAFQYRRSDDAWSGTIPTETDVLITHTPPRFHLDLPAGLGCDFLLHEVWKVRPRVHIFGHVHAGYGRESVFWDDSQRAHERLCARRDKGLVRDMVAVGAWIGLVKLAIYGVLGILWSRVWQGDCGGTLMVNSSLVYRSTGKLGNLPQVIDI
jgi:predicted phosphohydrolase